MDNRTCWLGGLTVGYSGCVSGSKGRYVCRRGRG